MKVLKVLFRSVSASRKEETKSIDYNRDIMKKTTPKKTNYIPQILGFYFEKEY